MSTRAIAAALGFIVLTACSSESGTGSSGSSGASSSSGSSGEGGSSGSTSSSGSSAGAEGPRLTMNVNDTPTDHAIASGKESVTISLADRAGIPADATGVYVQAITEYSTGCDHASWELVAPDLKAPSRRLFQEGPLDVGKNAVWMPLGASKSIVARVPGFECSASINLTVLGWARGVRLDLEDTPQTYDIPTGKESVTISLADHAAVPADADAVYVQTTTNYSAACDHANWQLTTPDANVPARQLDQTGPFSPGHSAVWMPIGPKRELVAKVPGFTCSASVEVTVLGAAKGLAVGLTDTAETYEIATGKESTTIPLAGRAGLPDDATAVYVQLVTQYDAGCDGASWEVLAPDVDAPARKLFQDGPLTTGKNAVWLPIGAGKKLVARVPTFKCAASANVTVLGWAKQ